MMALLLFLYCDIAKKKHKHIRFKTPFAYSCESYIELFTVSIDTLPVVKQKTHKRSRHSHDPHVQHVEIRIACKVLHIETNAIVN